MFGGAGPVKYAWGERAVFPVPNKPYGFCGR